MTHAYPTLPVSTAVDAEVNIYRLLREADVAVIHPPRPGDLFTFHACATLAVWGDDDVRCTVVYYRDFGRIYPEDHRGLYARADYVRTESFDEFADDTMLCEGAIVTTDWREVEAYLREHPYGKSQPATRTPP